MGIYKNIIIINSKELISNHFPTNNIWESCNLKKLNVGCLQISKQKKMNSVSPRRNDIPNQIKKNKMPHQNVFFKY